MTRFFRSNIIITSQGFPCVPFRACGAGPVPSRASSFVRIISVTTPSSFASPVWTNSGAPSALIPSLILYSLYSLCLFSPALILISPTHSHLELTLCVARICTCAPSIGTGEGRGRGEQGDGS